MLLGALRKILAMISTSAPVSVYYCLRTLLTELYLWIDTQVLPSREISNTPAKPFQFEKVVRQYMLRCFYLAKIFW